MNFVFGCLVGGVANHFAFDVPKMICHKTIFHESL
jgi:hypothetical protein